MPSGVSHGFLMRCPPVIDASVGCSFNFRECTAIGHWYALDNSRVIHKNFMGVNKGSLPTAYFGAFACDSQKNLCMPTVIRQNLGEIPSEIHGGLFYTETTNNGISVDL